MRARARFICIPAVLLAIAGCSSSKAPDLQDGWDWTIRSDVADATGADFDHTLGTISGQEDSSQELSLRSTSAPSDSPDSYAEAVASECEDYVRSGSADDKYFWQSYAISNLLRNAWSAAVAKGFSSEYRDAHLDVEARVTKNGPSLDDIQFWDSDRGDINPAWQAASDEQTALRKKYWAEDYSNLADEEASIKARGEDLWAQTFTESRVRDAQDFIVKKCDIVVPEGYVYPTAKDLGILVSDTA